MRRTLILTLGILMNAAFSFTAFASTQSPQSTSPPPYSEVIDPSLPTYSEALSNTLPSYANSQGLNNPDNMRLSRQITPILADYQSIEKMNKTLETAYAKAQKKMNQTDPVEFQKQTGLKEKPMLNVQTNFVDQVKLAKIYPEFAKVFNIHAEEVKTIEKEIARKKANVRSGINDIQGRTIIQKLEQAEAKKASYDKKRYGNIALGEFEKNIKIVEAMKEIEKAALSQKRKLGLKSAAGKANFLNKKENIAKNQYESWNKVREKSGEIHKKTKKDRDAYQNERLEAWKKQEMRENKKMIQKEFKNQIKGISRAR